MLCFQATAPQPLASFPAFSGLKPTFFFLTNRHILVLPSFKTGKNNEINVTKGPAPGLPGKTLK